MANMSLQKHPMPEQDPAVRAGNFKEVALGYTREIAMEEADRCLHCKNMPCVSGCPVNVPIPDFIEKIKAGDSRLKGQTGVDSYVENGLTKYTVGASENYNEIYHLRKSLLEKFPEAFIIAFKDGKRMDVQQAIREFKNKRVK